MSEFFTFGLGQPITETLAEILGGKGAGLMWMDSQGVPVPPGFVIPTTVWAEYSKKPKTTMKALAKEVEPYLQMLIKHFGYQPLLSVRSGARVSCPGMMDTILNVGMDVESEDFWRHKLGDKCYSDSLHRLITMYGSVVKGIDRKELEKNDVVYALEVYKSETREDFPAFKEQLLGAIEAVFKSWDNERAKIYRKQNNIPREWGTAVTVQAMVFGNLNDQSGTGVLFTRNPFNGECKVTGEFLVNAQGEDVVAGIRTPMSLEEMGNWNDAVRTELHSTVLNLEKLRRDMQDVEFTIQDGKLYILQTRNGKRTATASIRIALDMVKEGIITKDELVKRVSAKEFDLAQMPTISPEFQKEPSFTGIPACLGVVTGKPVFSSEDAINCKEPCILITQETTPDDIGGMYAARGVVTMIGGFTSHAAVVARGMNRACITGVGATLEAFKEVEKVSLDAATGRIWLEEVPIISGENNGLIGEFSKFVAEALGIVPVIFDVPTVKMDEALLYLGAKMLNPAGAAATVWQASKWVKKLYVDLTMGGTSYEAEFFSICVEYKPAQRVVDELEGLAKQEYSTLKDQLVLIGPVKSKTFGMLGTTEDLRSLVLAKDGVCLSGIDVQDPAIQKVLEWKKSEKIQFVSLGSYVPEQKSMVSLQQGLQLLAK